MRWSGANRQRVVEIDEDARRSAELLLVERGLVLEFERHAHRAAQDLPSHGLERGQVVGAGGGAGEPRREARDACDQRTGRILRLQLPEHLERGRAIAGVAKLPEGIDGQHGALPERVVAVSAARKAADDHLVLRHRGAHAPEQRRGRLTGRSCPELWCQAEFVAQDGFASQHVRVHAFGGLGRQIGAEARARQCNEDGAAASEVAHRPPRSSRDRRGLRAAFRRRPARRGLPIPSCPPGALRD